MEKIRISIEFSLPPVMAELDRKEMEASIECRRMVPSQLAGKIIDMIVECGLETEALQIQRLPERTLTTI